MQRGRLLLELLRVPEAHANLKRADDLVTAVAKDLGELLETEVTIEWEPATLSADPLAFNVTLLGEPFATLHLDLSAPPDPDVAEVLQHVVKDVTGISGKLTLAQGRAATHELRAALELEPDLRAVSEAGIRICVRNVEAESGLLLLRRAQTFRVLAKFGEWPDDPLADPDIIKVSTKGSETLDPLRHDELTVTMPLASSLPVRCMLLLRYAPGQLRPTTVFPILRDLSTLAVPFLDNRWRDLILHRLLELNRSTGEMSTAEMYQELLKTARGLIPGADSGTLLTRLEPDEPFRYQSAVGFDLEELAGYTTTEPESIHWYARSERDWRSGKPRLLRRGERGIDDFAVLAPDRHNNPAMRFDAIETTLCLPVLRDGMVMAVLNLDSTYKTQGMSSDSLRMASLFGAPLSTLLHKQHTHDLLSRAAMTDDLTGLANRRAFDEALERELDRARRAGPGPSLLLMDLKNFKGINDEHGHAVGDEVLIAVGRAIRASLRTIDVAARRGGDEFLALLIDTPASAVPPVVERVKHAIENLGSPYGQVLMNVGAASLETDGSDPVVLLKLADERMYEDKRATAV